MAAFEPSALYEHPLDFRLHGCPVMYLRATYLEDDVQQLERDGYDVVRMDASAWTSMSDAHDTIAATLNFPDYYGRNLSALDDSLGDVASYHNGSNPASTGSAIVFDGAGSFARRCPDDFAAIVNAFADAAVGAMRFGHRFLVLLHVDDPHLRIGLSSGSTDWNGREWLNSDRLPPANA